MHRRSMKDFEASSNDVYVKENTEEELYRRTHGGIATTSKELSNNHSKTLSHPSMPMSDRFSIILLLVLYTLQGIPMGLCGSIPMLLKDRGVSYEALSLFSLVSIPFSMKIIWAPLVDTFYSERFGRRKTWLVPAQLITGAMMIFGANLVRFWLRENDATDSEPDTLALTLFFLTLYFLMATQDIAVDGWALTMLSRDNVGYASACNAFGQALGIFVSNQGLIALSDATWCSRHLGLKDALVTLPGFMVFWGYVFIVTTLFVWVCKHEDSRRGADEKVETLRETIQTIYALCQLPSVTTFLTILLTSRIAFAAIDGAFNFKLQEYGVSKTTLATLSPSVLAVSFLSPALAGSFVTQKPLTAYLLGITARLIVSVLMWLLLQYTYYHHQHGERQQSDASDEPIVFMTIVLVLNEAASSLVFLSQMSFFSRISDPSIGGSYMTLLNTVANWGAKWPSTTALYLLPKLTWGICVLVQTQLHNNVNKIVEEGSAGATSFASFASASSAAALQALLSSASSTVTNTATADSTGDNLYSNTATDNTVHHLYGEPPQQLIPGVHCSSLTHDVICTSKGGACHIVLDGFTLLWTACLVFGVLWLRRYARTVLSLQHLPHSDWLVNGGGSKVSGGISSNNSHSLGHSSGNSSAHVPVNGENGTLSDARANGSSSTTVGQSSDGFFEALYRGGDSLTVSNKADKLR